MEKKDEWDSYCWERKEKSTTCVSCWYMSRGYMFQSDDASVYSPPVTWSLNEKKEWSSIPLGNNIYVFSLSCVRSIMMVIHLLHRHGWFLYMDIHIVLQKLLYGSLLMLSSTKNWTCTGIVVCCICLASIMHCFSFVNIIQQVNACTLLWFCATSLLSLCYHYRYTHWRFTFCNNETWLFTCTR